MAVHLKKKMTIGMKENFLKLLYLFHFKKRSYLIYTYFKIA